jgi:hypothetical protein
MRDPISTLRFRLTGQPHGALDGGGRFEVEDEGKLVFYRWLQSMVERR